MNLEKYDLLSNESRRSYEFFSEGPKGPIKKVVMFQEISGYLYNLAFGDWDDENECINDSVRTNNLDRDKVLASVASAVLDFISFHKDALIFAKGSTPEKNRLYQMSIRRHWPEISRLFDIVGFCRNRWEDFQSGRNYEAFLIKLK
ncbi:hypothetical protein QTN47_02200 [Danxiaibacter flavus]|uniref:Uncharacterized protein n=1 Tax=Danxiaibacter flavus TaxID=3049108 RepID=A0ABV3Z9L7_9BACT|nr:hypothetical protein QNM32_02200 [Chitinophagaceae bacterium DXS]